MRKVEYVCNSWDLAWVPGRNLLDSHWGFLGLCTTQVLQPGLGFYNVPGQVLALLPTHWGGASAPAFLCALRAQEHRAWHVPRVVRQEETVLTAQALLASPLQATGTPAFTRTAHCSGSLL